ncbi:MAG: SPFH domain-containing protein [Bacteroidota bacterium]
MSLWKKMTGQFIDIIEWLDDSHDTLVHRFERADNEIKNGAKLVVREGQIAVLVNEGQLADVYEPGTVTLETQNMPILSTLKGWKYGFESPFKAEVYFVSTRQFTDLKWGTKNPIMLRDPEFGPTRLRAFGTYAMRVGEPVEFLREVVGTNARFRTDGITDQLRNLVVSRFTDALGESKLAVLDLAANTTELGDFLHDKIAPDFGQYGLELVTLLVENVSLPPAVEKALDERTSMGVIGNLGAYTQFQAAQAMGKAAENPGGGASEGIGMGMGFAMAQQMANQMGGQQGAAQPPPPPPPAAPTFHVAVDGQTTGPFDMAALQQQAATGALTAATHVWAPSLGAWTPAGQVEALRSLFPPPPPPAS